MLGLDLELEEPLPLVVVEGVPLQVVEVQVVRSGALLAGELHEY